MIRFAVLAAIIGTAFQIPSFVQGQTGTQPYKEPEAQINWSTDAEGKQYVATLLIATLKRTPDWDDEDENPPLSARKARSLAQEVFDEIAPYGKEAECRATLKLRDDGDDKWFWVVYFTPLDGRGFQSTFPIPVLFDGSVVRPEINFGGQGP